MQLTLIRSSIMVVLTSCFATAQQPPATSPDATIQALLKEVHALRLALEQSNQIGPRIQIGLARMQLQEERVRNATRQLQDARDKLAEIQMNRARYTDHIKQLEMQPSQSADPNARKQMGFGAHTIQVAPRVFESTGTAVPGQRNGGKFAALERAEQIE